MKNIHSTLRLLLAFGLLIVFGQCDKDVQVPVFEAYPETSLDANGGTWKTFVLANGSQIDVPAPEASASAAYLAELADLKTKMAAATAEQQEQARHWGANGVLRWHAIAR